MWVNMYWIVHHSLVKCIHSDTYRQYKGILSEMFVCICDRVHKAFQEYHICLHARRKTNRNHQPISNIWSFRKSAHRVLCILLYAFSSRLSRKTVFIGKGCAVQSSKFRFSCECVHLRCVIIALSTNWKSSSCFSSLGTRWPRLIEDRWTSKHDPRFTSLV